MVMEALVCRKLGDPTVPLSDATPISVSRSHPVPELTSPTAVRIRVRATSLNYANYLQILGKYQEKPPLPFIPGSDYSGVVDSVGDRVSRFKVGDKVCSFASLGSFAEFIVAEEKDLLLVPDGCDLVAAGALPVAFGTSHVALVHRAQLKPGQVLLVLGAAGGVGLSAVQIGKVCGAVVIAVARGEPKVRFLQSMGVDHVVDLGKGNVIESVKHFLKARGLKGVDVLYDPVGGKLTKESMKLLNWGAQILVIGFASGEVPVIPANISSMDLAALLAFLLLFSAATLTDVGRVEGSIHTYDREPFKEVGNAFLISGGSEGIVASDPAAPLSSSGIADGRSYIRFKNITFWRTKYSAEQHSSMEHSTGLIQAIIFEASDRDNIGGSAYGGQRSICCTPDLAKLEGCKQGEVIRRLSSVDLNWPVVINTHFSANYLSTALETEDIPITKTGMYNLFFISCDPKLRGLSVSGKTVWKNPGGYLPGRMAPSMTFYIFMSLAYLMLSFIWFAQYARFWRDVLPLQNCITLVIALGLFETTLWYFEYLNFNNTGMRPVGITTWVVTVGAVRKTVSRLILLSISMGYGVVRPTLGGLTSKVLLLGVTYFLASELLDIEENVGTINDFSGKAKLFLVLPDAFLDAFIILWIFTSLSRTLEKLQARRSSVKLDIYRKFANALVLAVISSVAWIGYEVYFKATDPFSERWQSAWIITAFWDILSFALLCVVCYLWAPSQSSQRYAYSGEIGEDDDEEAQSLTKGTSDGDLGLVKLDKKERSVDHTDAYSLEDESEEDKRE